MMRKSKIYAIAAVAALHVAATQAQTPTEGEEIDLGLSVNWRGYNIGATAPQEKGTLYSFACLKNCGNMYGYPYFSQYTGNFDLPDGDIAGNTEYDAAAATTGGDWRMASKAQWEELIEGCDITSLTYEGTSGYLLTSKSNGNSIFLPSSTYGYKQQCSYYTSESDTYSQGIEMPQMVTISGGGKYTSGQVKLQEYSYSSFGPWIGLPIRAVCDRHEGPELEGISLAAGRTEIFAGTSTTVTATAVPADVPLRDLKYSSSDESIATVSNEGKVTGRFDGTGGTVTITASSGNVTSTIDITVTAVATDASEETVDLGLSVDWLSRNEGASDRGETGDKYAFAYITPGIPDSYKFYDRYNDQYLFTKNNYCGDEEYDVVAANSNGRDRLPSGAEMEELVENCEATYIPEGTYGNSTHCVRMTSTVNGKWILLPLSSPFSDSTNKTPEITYHSGCTNAEKNKSISIMLQASNDGTVTVKCGEADFGASPVRGVREHETAPDLSGIELNKTAAEVYIENTVALTASPLPLGAKFESLQWSSDDESVATVTADGLVTGMGAGTVLIRATDGTVTATATITVNDPTPTDGEYVDWGNGMLWYPKELGAATAADYGAYYYWGEPMPRQDTVSDESQWTDPGLSKIGGTQYDPATAALGGSWQLPTTSDFLSLLDNSTIEWITYKGKRGALLTSKLNGARMFCHKKEHEMYSTNYVFYWADSSTTYTSSGLAGNGLSIIEDNTDTADLGTSKPWDPQRVRPIMKKSDGIDAPSAEGERVVTGVFTIDGRIANEGAENLSPGIYIIRYNDGSAIKQVVR